MDEHQPPADWVGEAVMLNGADVGVLDRVSDFGIVVRMPYTLWWYSNEPSDDPSYFMQTRTQVERVIPVFRPWHTISEIRPLESDEAEAYDL